MSDCTLKSKIMLLEKLNIIGCYYCIQVFRVQVHVNYVSMFVNNYKQNALRRLHESVKTILILYQYTHRQTVWYTGF